MKFRILFFLLIFYFTTIAQEQCKEGFFTLTQKDEKISLILVKTGHIFPNRNIKEEELFVKMNHYNTLNHNETTNITSSLIKTKARLSICFKSFKEQIQAFINKETNEVTLISKTGIPFLTFTRIE